MSAARKADPGSPEALRQSIERDARRLGFDAVGVTRANRQRQLAPRLAAFVEGGRHGSMTWLQETLERRADPLALWPQARSIIMLAMNYTPGQDPLDNLSRPDRANISVYARNRDYHEVVKGRLKEVSDKLRAVSGKDAKVFVDTAPVMEKPLAAEAGLGWQGKHTNLVSRTLGSWFFLGCIFSEADVADDPQEADHCGSCRACMDACPTDAFPAPYQLDARRCISYLTIEHDGMIDAEFRKLMGNRIYGCDDCLAACPWNKFAKVATEAKLTARHDLASPPLARLLAMDDAAFRSFFSGSPVKRIGRDRFMRNVLIAAGNSADAALAGQVALLLADASPLVRAAAVWALGELAGKDAALRHIPVLEDADIMVRSEIERLQLQ